MGMVYSRHRDGGAVHCRCEAFGRSCSGAGFSGCGFPEGLGSRLFRKIRKRFQVKLKLTVTRFFGFVFGLLGGGLNTLVVFHCLFWHVKTTPLTEHMIYPCCCGRFLNIPVLVKVLCKKKPFGPQFHGILILESWDNSFVSCVSCQQHLSHSMPTILKSARSLMEHEHSHFELEGSR